MRYERVDGKVVPVISRTRAKVAPVDGQYCQSESDRRLREIIRGMTDRERKIVFDEVRAIDRERSWGHV